FRQLHHRPHRRDEFQPGRPRVAVRSRLGVADVQNNILTRSQSMFRISLMAVAFAALWTTAASAAVSADEAKQLGTTLTPVGAEKAANKEGTIPEWTGGLTTPPATFQKGSGIRTSPFPDEKPR